MSPFLPDRLSHLEAQARFRRDDESAQAARRGSLRVVAGSSDRDEYALDAHTFVIGRAKSSLVRLRAAGSLILEFRLEEPAPVAAPVRSFDSQIDSGMDCWM
jgi:hypothetical protein